MQPRCTNVLQKILVLVQQHQLPSIKWPRCSLILLRTSNIWISHKIYKYHTSKHILNIPSQWLDNNILSSLCESVLSFRIDLIHTFMCVFLPEMESFFPLPNNVIVHLQMIFYIMCPCCKGNDVHDDEYLSFSLDILGLSHDICTQ